MQHWYGVKVINRLDEAQRLVGTIYPLSLRLEVLENVFSLLFVTVNDCLSSRSTTHSGDDSSDDADSSEGSGGANAAKWVAKFISSSAFSSEGSYRVGRDGFVCPPFLVRDLVLWVSVGLDQLQVDDVVQQQAPEYTTLNATFVSDAPSGRYRDRVVQLSRHLSDAKWRLDLLIGTDQLEMTYGRVHALSLLRPARFGRPPSTAKGRTRSQSQQQRGVARGGEETGVARRKRSGMEAPRRPTPVNTGVAAKARGVPLDVVAFLLAAPETMIAICLKTGRHERVPEVMKVSLVGPTMCSTEECSSVTLRSSILCRSSTLKAHQWQRSLSSKATSLASRRSSSNVTPPPTARPTPLVAVSVSRASKRSPSSAK